MQNMFKDKRGQTIEFKPIIELKLVIASVNMVDVNVTTQNKTSEKHVLKDRKPKKNNLQQIGKLKKSMVETMQ